MEKVNGYHRDGKLVGQFEVESFSKGTITRESSKRATCTRCGGQGGSDAWKYTGWTCYKCGGAGGYRVDYKEKIYTAEKLEKLNQSKAKRTEKKIAEIAAKQEAEAKRIAEEEEAFFAQWGELLNEAAYYQGRSDFVADVVTRATTYCKLTEGQAEALKTTIAKFKASDAQKAASEWIGEVGDRVTFKAKVVMHRVLGEGYAYGTLNHMVKLITEEGNSVVYFGSKPSTVGVCFDWETDEYTTEKEWMTITATVKKTDEYRGEKTTTITRPSIK